MPVWSPEEKLISFLDSLDEEASDSRNDVELRTSENIDIIRGKQWKGPEAPHFLFNVVEASLEDKIGKLSESRPKIAVLPSREGLDDAAKLLHNTTSSIWDRHELEYETERIAMYGAATGVAVVGTPYNPNLSNGVGDVDFIVKDPTNFGCDMAMTQSGKVDRGEYVILEDCVPVDILKAQYPGRGSEIKPDEKVSGFAAKHPKTAGGVIRDAYARLIQRKTSERKSAIPRALIKEYYVQDRRKNIDDDGVVPMIEGITRPAIRGKPFPGGRRIIRQGNIILEDTFNPYWDGLFPVDMLSWKVDLKSVWGPDEVQSIKRLQEAINRIGDAYTRTTILNSVVRVIMDYGALTPDERNKISNQVGQFIEKAVGRNVEFNVPPVLPKDTIDFVHILIGLVREKVGVVRNPAMKDLPSIVTGPAIEGLQLMIETPIRTAARRLEAFYRRIGQKMISRIFQYYTSDRLIQMVGPDKRWVNFEFVRHKLIIDPKTGQPRTDEDLRKAYNDFYFAIEPGSSLAITRVERVMAKSFFVQQGWLHPEEVLAEAGFANPEEKLKRAQEARETGLIQPPDNKKGKNNGAGSLFDANIM